MTKISDSYYHKQLIQRMQKMETPTRKTIPAEKQDQVDNAVQIAESRNDMVSFNEQFGQIASGELHNFKGGKMDIYRLISKATGPTCKNADELGDKVIDLESFFIHQVQLVNAADGEITDCIRTVLIDKSGDAYAFVSSGVFNDIRRLISTFGMGPYNGDVKVRVVASRTSKQRRIYSIVPA